MVTGQFIDCSELTVMPQTALGLTELPNRQHRIKWSVGQPMINGNGR